MTEQTSNRDFNREGESFVKGYIVATIGDGDLYFEKLLFFYIFPLSTSSIMTSMP